MVYNCNLPEVKPHETFMFTQEHIVICHTAPLSTIWDICSHEYYTRELTAAHSLIILDRHRVSTFEPVVIRCCQVPRKSNCYTPQTKLIAPRVRSEAPGDVATARINTNFKKTKRGTIADVVDYIDGPKEIKEQLELRFAGWPDKTIRIPSHDIDTR